MELSNFLVEIQVGEDADVNKLFNWALTQVYSKEYLNKINKFITDKLQIKEMVKNNTTVAESDRNGIIYINKPLFYGKPKQEQVKFLLHEFVHIQQNKRNFIISKTFQEIHELSEELYNIVKKNLTTSMSEFLTGREQQMPTSDSYEIIAYLMNGSVKISSLKPEGKKQFIAALTNSGLFNIGSPFWLKRLNK